MPVEHGGGEGFDGGLRLARPLALTDTSGGYNLESAGFPHLTPRPSQPIVLHFPSKGPARSQVIQSQHKPLVKWCETPITDPWSFDHSASTENYVYA
jgi:hypothetical protein